MVDTAGSRDGPGGAASGHSGFPVNLVRAVLKVHRATKDPKGPSLAVTYSVRYGKPVLTFRTGARAPGGRCGGAERAPA